MASLCNRFVDTILVFVYLEAKAMSEKQIGHSSCDCRGIVGFNVCTLAQAEYYSAQNTSYHSKSTTPIDGYAYGCFCHRAP